MGADGVGLTSGFAYSRRLLDLREVPEQVVKFDPEAAEDFIDWNTELRKAPEVSGRLSDFWISGVTSCVATPSQPRVMAPVVFNASATGATMAEGMAKPMPTEPPEGE